MPKKKLHTCTARGPGWKCTARYTSGAGGTVGPEGRCAPHYQQFRRTGEVQPLRDPSKKIPAVKLYIWSETRELLQKRAKDAGVPVAHYLHDLLVGLRSA